MPSVPEQGAGCCLAAHALQQLPDSLPCSCLQLPSAFLLLPAVCFMLVTSYILAVWSCFSCLSCTLLAAATSSGRPSLAHTPALVVGVL
jgi:hypothetical protein